MKDNFLTKSWGGGGGREVSEFHRSPMQTEVRNLPPHRREGGTLENIIEERPNAAKATTPQRIFAHTNPLTQLGAYEGGFSFNGGLDGHHATACRREWQ